MTYLFKTLFFIFACIILNLDIASGQQIAQFRGSNRDGIYNGSNLLTLWPETGPVLKWFNEEIGKGYSTPTVTSNAIYVTGKIDSLEYLTSLDKKGVLLWKVDLGKAWNRTFPESRCTPTVDENNVYVVTSYGEVICVDKNKVKKRWSINIYQSVEGKSLSWGIGESLLLVDDKVIFTPAGPKTTIVALNKNTGEMVWQTKSINDTANYSSPIMVEFQGKKIILSALQSNAIAVDAENGKILCSYKFDMDRRPLNVNTPIFKDGRVFFTAGYNSYSYMFELSDDLSRLELVWRDTIMDCEYGYVVLKNGYLYGSNYISIRQGNWWCVEWETGKLKYEATWETKGPLSLAGDMLYCLDERKGNIALVKANPEKFEVISSFRLPKGHGPCWANPVINEGIMYVRRGNTIMAI